ncbi:MAG: hypothetical protein MJ158_02890 [Alphaproteobacteria bacterium]|nr:hypothetical protein [Alphaproteobacteria bacterium]
MFGKIKKIFFTGVFGILYVSFIAQFVFVLTQFTEIFGKEVKGCFAIAIALAVLSVEWLVLIAARYLSKKSSSNNQQHMNNFRRH